jgi:hypothetical protein
MNKELKNKLEELLPGREWTLVSLIKACGDDFLYLVRSPMFRRDEADTANTWFARSRDKASDDLGQDQTPEDAVARLLISLQR